MDGTCISDWASLANYEMVELSTDLKLDMQDQSLCQAATDLIARAKVFEKGIISNGEMQERQLFQRSRFKLMIILWCATGTSTVPVIVRSPRGGSPHAGESKP